MNEMTEPTTGQDRRSREIAAKRRVDEAWEALEQARRKVGARKSEVRNLQGDKGQSAEVGHAAAEAMREDAEKQFRRALRDYLPQLKNLIRPAPDPLPAATIALGLLAGYDAAGIYAALHEAIDAAAADPSMPVFIASTEAELEHRVTEKRKELSAYEDRLEELEREHAFAETEHREIVTEGR
jgi:hypothetical protein